MDTRYEARGYLTENFHLFHLKDRPKQNFDWHYHDFHKIIVFLAGQGNYSIESERFPLRPGDFIFVSRGCVHRPEITDAEDYERIILYISPEYLKRAGGDCNLETCFDRTREQFRFVAHPGKKYGHILDLLTELESLTDDTGFGSTLLAESVFLRFLITVTRAVEDSGLTYVPAANTDPKILSILQYLAEHLTEPLTAEDLSRQFSISKYHMMRRFKDATGCTIHSYLTAKRLLLARELMHSGISATNACFDSGFGDYSAFSRAYKKLFGTSPKGK